MSTSATDATIGGHPRREDDIALFARLVTDGLKNTVIELRKDEETRMSVLRGEISAFHDGEMARLEKAIADLKPPPSNIDPTTNFWTVYKKVADEHDNDLISRYVGDLDTSLLFAGLFSAVTTTFIVQIIPALQPDPSDLTNVLLLQILRQNTSFGGDTPLAPISNIPIGIVRAQSILFASLCITLVVAFIAVLGKQWILYYTRATTWGSIVDRGKERQVKLAGLQKWGLHFIMEALPVMLQFALLLFAIAIIVYLWGLNVSVAEVVLGITSVGLVFYAFVTVAAIIWSDCPFQTPLSVLLPRVLPWVKESTTLAYAWLRRGGTSLTTSLLFRIKRVAEDNRLASSLGSFLKIFPGGMNTSIDNVGKGAFGRGYPKTLSNPIFWRQDPLFTSPIPKNIAASAGFWLLENSTDFSAATAVAAVFSEIQWPSHLRCTTALIRLRDTYVECFRAPEFDESTRLKALQSAAAYYVLYHTQLIWSTSKSPKVEIESLPPDLPPDLFLHQHNGKWGGDDVFEHLLRAEDRSEPVTSARFLSYIAPYWFCGDSDATIKVRPSRLSTLNELIEVLEKSHALVSKTLTDCVLCAGAVMDFPLHPEDLIRVDKSDYFVPTFKAVVEHIHGIILARGSRHRYAKDALEILVTIAEKASLPLVDGAWIMGLLMSAAEKDMDDEKFILFMRLSARRKGEETKPDSETPSGQEHVQVQDGIRSLPHGEVVPSETPTPEYLLFTKIMKNVRTWVEKGGSWHEESVYGGLIVIKDIPRLGSCLPEDESLRMLSKAMEKGEAGGENRPFRIRKAVYDAIVVARDGWLKAPKLRPTLEVLDIPRKLHNIVSEIGLPDAQCSFLGMMEILSEDRYWHPYLRRAMEIWLPLHHVGPEHAHCILSKVGELLLPRRVEKPLEKILEEEWAAVPGRPPKDLTVDLLQPLAEVTEQFKKQSFFTESDRGAVLAMVEKVIPSLEKRRDSDYSGPGDDIRGVVNDLLEVLRSPMQSTKRW